ncbi:MAG: hypothetical protein GY898_16620 [Proteobacteria bacterium]|nr:hypothetical protein [Pseudomonadota bacterium]
MLARLFPALVAVALAGCTAPAFEIIVSNTGEETTYVEAGEGSGMTLRIEEEIDGSWRSLASSRSALCAPRCGAPGAVVCAAMAAELNVVHALLPGDSASRTYDSEWWWLDPSANCIRQTALAGPARATVCHGPEAEFSNLAPWEEPVVSGPIGASEGGADVIDPVCEALSFDLAVTTRVNLELAE